MYKQRLLLLLLDASAGGYPAGEPSARESSNVVRCWVKAHISPCAQGEKKTVHCPLSTLWLLLLVSCYWPTCHEHSLSLSLPYSPALDGPDLYLLKCR